MIALSVLYFLLIIKEKQDEKNKRKAEAEKRRSIDKIFDEAPTGFTQSGYAGFEDTPMMEGLVQAWFKAGRTLK